MSSPPPVIVGAGLAGLIAAHAWPTARVVERMAEPTAAHKALLRFRTDIVSRLTGIPFRKVRVRKGIWYDGAYREPNIQLANWYSQKCTGLLIAERSIWSIEPADRFIAPLDFHEQLLYSTGPRVKWGAEMDLSERTDLSTSIITTAPLSETIRILRGPPEIARFDRAPIYVQRFMLPEELTDVHQTVYFPDPACALYRASITGHVLILEFAGDPSPGQLLEGKYHALNAFGVQRIGELMPMGEVKQQYGKIAPVDDAARKQVLFRLTHEQNIYSLGRFATWRNILLDDVVADIDVIKRLMRSGAYELRHSS